MRDAERYGAILKADYRARGGVSASLGPVVCLGTRNGREVDLFRVAFFGPRFRRRVVRWLEHDRRSFRSRWAALDALGRSRVEPLSGSTVIGVEINPRGGRQDVWVGSFDAMPSAWGQRFGVLFSNAFDQSEDPERTATEWRRIARPGAYVIFCFNDEAEPTETDPVGAIELDDVLRMFKGRLLYFQRRGSRNNYSEAIIRLA
jgi:hypothetical protein